ncbi:Laccase [Zalerion maritima]|uniref:Laccase n=1 Tax=Zalerion maritima TaxID=339359 RepID=A0AAD5RQE8_9PEZI|nr:Laccase [Zalerion maritima]
MLSRSLLAVASFLLPSLVSGSPLMRKSQNSTCEYDSVDAYACWGDYSLSTNCYDEVPDTGVTREYWFDLTNTTAAPDGVERVILAINGSVPGPTITADWGDTVVVHLKNSLESNGTSLHFHGIRQNNTNSQDGVASITQCPLAPGDSMTYTWRATQYGSSWYHSHFALQAWNGLFGGIQINGPHSAPYDEDLGILFLNDWSHETADALYEVAQTSGPPQMDNGLINGTNTYDGAGSRFTTAFESGKKYRMRLVNGAIDTHFKFFIDNHNLTVITSDFVPINPYETDMVSIGIGQRYDVIVEANQDTGNYWMRAVPQTTCSTNANTLDIKGIVRYDSSSTDDPTTDVIDYDDTCLDEDMDNLVPVVSLDAGSSSYDETMAVGLSVINGAFKWTLNSVTFLSDWDYPTLQQVLDGNDTYRDGQQIVELPERNQWVYFIIQNNLGLPHPIHLHGHDFWVLAQGPGTYDGSGAALRTTDAPRRDVAVLPGTGHLVIGFYTDNPGIWLMHCHIGWHTSEGFALQLVERIDEIPGITDAGYVGDACASWETYSAAAGIVQIDSGV